MSKKDKIPKAIEVKIFIDKLYNDHKSMDSLINSAYKAFLMNPQVRNIYKDLDTFYQSATNRARKKAIVQYVKHMYTNYDSILHLLNNKVSRLITKEELKSIYIEINSFIYDEIKKIEILKKRVPGFNAACERIKFLKNRDFNRGY